MSLAEAGLSSVPTMASGRTRPAVRVATTRDLRLDFYRGLAMFIIFVAHVPFNPWALWIPARFGFSDATEIFVFCSGMASAFAFGRTFGARGWPVGAARTLYRAWQIYWVHIGLFVALAGILVLIDGATAVEDGHVAGLELQPFFADPAAGLAGLVTLRYVPKHFDILPMYFGILLLLPLVMAARSLGRWAPAFLVGGLWFVAQLGWLGLPAEPWSDRVWFFNPFGWQLVFFTGFAFASGWIGAPPVSPRLVALAAAVLLVSVPFVHFAALDASPFLAAAADRLAPLASKTELGLLRYLHFLTLAYLAYVVSGPGGERLRASGATGVVASAIHKVGQQALATFVMGMICARLAPVLLDALGGSALAVAATNLAGFAVLIATAYVAGWFRTERTAPRA